MSQKLGERAERSGRRLLGAVGGSIRLGPSRSVTIRTLVDD